jgi:coproporphyrinogen III oxidase
MNPNIEPVKAYLLHLQEQIASTVASLDPDLERNEDHWTKEAGGGGVTLAFSAGQVFEKAGINFSHVWGRQLPPSATATRPEWAQVPFQAVGLSLIMHPRNPFVPTCHANWRFFIANPQQQATNWWFGGGFDLTPYYAFVEDCVHWHRMAKKACDPYGQEVYPRFKEWADRYFYIKHREEPRGIGGIFFDDLNQWDFATCFAFIKSVGEQFQAAYFPIVRRRMTTPFGDKERAFQCFRRGRYVEFNLVYDRGTLFGLQSGGRIESILISLPPLVAWHYDWHPDKGTREAELYEKYLPPQDWANKA